MKRDHDGEGNQEISGREASDGGVGPTTESESNRGQTGSGGAGDRGRCRRHRYRGTDAEALTVFPETKSLCAHYRLDPPPSSRRAVSEADQDPQNRDKQNNLTGAAYIVRRTGHLF